MKATRGQAATVIYSYHAGALIALWLVFSPWSAAAYLIGVMMQAFYVSEVERKGVRT